VNGTTLTYLHSDHLGSNSLMSKQNGTSVVDSQTWYLPFGDYRGTTPSQTLTDQGYTGHKENMELGLIYMNARYYLPSLNRFISADTIVPDPQNPQSFNRYSYVLNNPVNFTDPTGHRECGASNDCSDPINGTPQDRLATAGFDSTVHRLWIDPESVDSIQYYGNTNFAFNLSEKAKLLGVENIPYYGYSQGFHGGVDLVAEAGTKVYAGVYGTVEYVDDWNAYTPRYVKIKIAPDTYVIIGHLSADEPTNLEAGQLVTPSTVVGVVSEEQDHTHLEFWNDSGTLTLRTPYDYMSSEVAEQFFALKANMLSADSRTTFHSRDDGQWQSVFDQPSLLYGGDNPNLNEGQPGYDNPWD
jgi:RHS repeat-associated protein